MLIRMCGCAGLSAPLFFAYGISRFSQDMAQMTLELSAFSNYVLFSWASLTLHVTHYNHTTTSEKWKLFLDYILITIPSLVKSFGMRDIMKVRELSDFNRRQQKQAYHCFLLSVCLLAFSSLVYDSLVGILLGKGCPLGFPLALFYT